MDADTYQSQASRTLLSEPDFVPSGRDLMQVWNALGLVGEAGEVAELIKKGIFHRHGVDMNELRKEIGDVLWYVAALCTRYDIPLSEVMGENIAKLAKRYPRGYSSADSKDRQDLKDR